MAGKIAPLSGFPEWLPEQRLVEQAFVDRVRAKFESFGYASIETRCVEPLEHLLAKGETDKEIYVLRRLHAGDDEDDKQVGLPYDLTVPFARYVAQNRGRLVFPFKRYQIQKAWRGERPQEGRYREFRQADFDVVCQDELPLHFDAEVPVLVHEVLSSLPGIPPVVLHVNNRKLLQGFYAGLGIGNAQDVLRAVDKLDKIGEDAVREMLTGELGVDATAADKCLDLARIQTPDASFADAVRALGVTDPLLDQGIEELAFVMDAVRDLPGVVADLRIARGLDYYTGTVYEGVMPDNPKIGTVCGGGRYDNLVADMAPGARFPGVGISIGITRILGPLLAKDRLIASRSTPTCVLVVLNDEDSRAGATVVAAALRARGVPTEVFHDPVKFGKQIKYASRKGIPFVWFPPSDPDGAHEVKDIRSGDQTAADPATWTPPDEALRPRIDSAD